MTVSTFFAFRELLRLKVQTDAFNVLNKTNYSGLDSNVSDSAFGRLNDA